MPDVSRDIFICLSSVSECEDKNMSFKSETRLQLEKWRVMQRKGLGILFASIFIAGSIGFILEIVVHGGSPILIPFQILFSLLAFFGLFLVGKGMSHAWNLRCPHCRKKVGYLVIDPNYSKCFFPMLRLPDFPDRIKQCPFCRFDLESEPEERG